MRIGIRQRPFQTFAAKDHDEAMALAGFDDDLRVAHFFDFLGQQIAKLFADFGLDPSGPAVGHDAFRIERAKVGARRHVAGFEFEAQTERFDHAAAHLKFQRVITKQGEMTRAAAGRDARRDRNHPSLRGVFGERVEIRSGRRFQWRHVALFLRRDVAQTIEDDENNFRNRF